MTRALAASIFLALAPATSAWAGWQRDLTCGHAIGGCGGQGCDPCPTVGSERTYERQESPQERADRLERQAQARRDREAAAKAMKIHTQRTKLSQAELAGASRAALASATTPGDVLTPGGSPLFQQGPAEPGQVVMGRAVGAIRTPASAIPLENLRRAAAVLGAATSGLSTEDQAFLAREAGQAMDGAALTVFVPPGRAPSSEQTDELRRFTASAQSFAAVESRSTAATAVRIDAAKAFAQASAAADAPGGDRAARGRRRDELKSAYDASVLAESSAKSAAKAAAGTVTYRVVP